ncbi:MAG: HAMP domain-containing histidine kinase [Mogibacterium sp.]|nr:HAMP domain-containing histidine kinase [Mogibacterium sp.]
MAEYIRIDKKVDTGSIKTATLVSFVVFALVLIAFLWSLMYFFMNTYYETLRTQEVIRTANSIETQYNQHADEFDRFAVQTAGANGIYIRIDSETESHVYDGTSAIHETGTFGRDIQMIADKLRNSPLESVTATRMSSTSDENSRLIYAAHIGGTSSTSTLYIIAPLYPDPVTIRIVKNMLMYISLIVLTVALMLAFALSGRLANPIENLTKSATELSKGNYNVKFDGAGFTETKELARALNKASYEMEKTDFYQREIIANVSHDLKTPLTMIRSYAEKIIDISGDNPEKRNSDLHIIISETERLNRLVTDMMSVSNLQSNNVELHKETFDLVEAAEDVYESFKVLSSSEGFEMHFHPCKSTYVVGDRSRIMQVMTNFVSNAVKYSGDNKFIDIQVVRTGNKKVAFHCIDHGMGIPSDEIGHVWDKYYRTSANHERGIEGTGLGLAIVKGILNLHSAKYGVNSEEGKGSDFWFEMDSVKKPSPRSKTNTKEERSSSGE